MNDAIQQPFLFYVPAARLQTDRDFVPLVGDYWLTVRTMTVAEQLEHRELRHPLAVATVDKRMLPRTLTIETGGAVILADPQSNDKVRLQVFVVLYLQRTERANGIAVLSMLLAGVQDTIEAAAVARKPAMTSFA
jgi:hypothetical protein